MDGTRMGSRSSTRHGPASVFSGPVRRWKKTWAPISTSNPSPVASRVLLYKWVPLSAGAKDEAAEEPTTRPVRYLPVSVILAQRKEAARRAAEEAEAAAQATVAAEQTSITAGDSAVEVSGPDPMDSGDRKEMNMNISLKAKGSPLDERGQEGQSGGGSRENDPSVLEKRNEVEGMSTDIEMQEQTADEKSCGVSPSGRNEDQIEVLSD